MTMKQNLIGKTTGGSALLLGLAALFLFSACAGRQTVAPPPEADLSMPAEIDSASLAPGLSVLYLYGLNMRHINDLPDPEATLKRGKPGKPIPQLNHKFGSNKVFDSGTNRKIALQMDGFIHLSEPGDYRFQANSNDGIRIFISKKRIINDPDVHSDRLSTEGVFSVEKGGWFPIRVRYFQRKGTATLQFFWQPPGTDAFSIVPAEAYAHLPVK